MIESIRKSGEAVLLLDGGGAFGNQKDLAELQMKAMELMRYDALNLGGPEFGFGVEFLDHTRSHASFPYIASNLLSSGSRLPWTREYLLKEVGGIRVAILGLFNPEDIDDRERVPTLEVLPPEAALNKLLPEVRGKADLVILLSRFETEKTRALVESVKGIDVAISSGSDYASFAPPAGEETAVVVKTGSLGKTLGLLKITIDEKQAHRVSERRDVVLGRDIPDNAAMRMLMERHTKDQEAAKQAQKLKEENARKELMEGLQLSPEQFMNRYRQGQTEQRTGAPR